MSKVIGANASGLQSKRQSRASSEPRFGLFNDVAKRSIAGARANALSLATKFAALLDRDRFAVARRLMAPRCCYRFRGNTVVGASKIVDMYRANSLKGRKLLDELRYESKVEGVRGGAVSILYIDHLRKGHHAHAHRCRQFLRISNGKIIAIRHSDLRGEAKMLRQFFKTAGVQWK